MNEMNYQMYVITYRGEPQAAFSDWGIAEGWFNAQLRMYPADVLAMERPNWKMILVSLLASNAVEMAM